uniref:Secreted protein n=1 Tax=Parascaris equorum TaxID=6256 RepID=A0A914RI23_PAREQ
MHADLISFLSQACIAAVLNSIVTSTAARSRSVVTSATRHTLSFRIFVATGEFIWTDGSADIVTRLYLVTRR